MKWVILPTDLVVAALLAILVFYCAWVAREPVRRQAWARVFSRPSAAVAATVLALFTGVAALDSVHFRTAIGTPAPGAPAVYSPVTAPRSNTSSPKSSMPPIRSEATQSPLRFVNSIRAPLCETA